MNRVNEGDAKLNYYPLVEEMILEDDYMELGLYWMEAWKQLNLSRISADTYRLSRQKHFGLAIVAPRYRWQFFLFFL